MGVKPRLPKCGILFLKILFFSSFKESRGSRLGSFSWVGSLPADLNGRSTASPFCAARPTSARGSLRSNRHFEAPMV